MDDDLSPLGKAALIVGLLFIMGVFIVGATLIAGDPLPLR